MRKKIKGVTLAFPCPKEWNQMQEGQGHKVCQSCKCKVYDFTQADASDLEKLHLQSEQRLCGKFTRSQVSEQVLKYAASLVLPSLGQNSTDSLLIPAVENSSIPLDSVAVEEETFIGIIVEQMPEPKRGYKRFQAQLQEALIIPAGCPVGTVFVGFVVDTAGKIQDLQVLKGFFEPADKEALQVLQRIQVEVTPAKQGNGRLV